MLTRSTARNLKQVTNLLCTQANSASYPQQDGEQVVVADPCGEWRPLQLMSGGKGTSRTCTYTNSARHWQWG